MVCSSVADFHSFDKAPDPNLHQSENSDTDPQKALGKVQIKYKSFKIFFSFDAGVAKGPTFSEKRRMRKGNKSFTDSIAAI